MSTAIHSIDTSELTDFVISYERFQSSKEVDHVRDIIRVLVDKQRITCAYRMDALVGYIEYWRLDFEQTGRVLLNEMINIESEDIETGPVAYLANISIAPPYYHTNVFEELRDAFREANRDASYWIGHAQRKQTGLLKIFKKPKYTVHNGGNNGQR